MNRTLNRPMFRIGGSAGTGITSGLDRPGYANGTDPQDRTFKPNIEQALQAAELSKDSRVRNLLFPTSGGLRPGSLPGFFNKFWFKFSFSYTNRKYISNSSNSC